MLKTVKVKKQLRLDELIKYIFDNDIAGKRFEERSDYKSYSIIHAVHVTGEGVVNVEGLFNPDTTFTVEVEEEITKDTRFKGVQEIYIDDEGLLQLEYHPILARKSLNDVLEEHDEETECLYIYAAVDGKTELIWEADSDGV